MTYDDIRALSVAQFEMLLSRIILIRPPQLTRHVTTDAGRQCKAILDVRLDGPVAQPSYRTCTGFGENHVAALAHAVVYAWKLRAIPQDWRKLCEPAPTAN